MSAVFSPINKWPEDERPREKLLRDGEHRLSNAELLAILIDTGSRGSSSLDLARLLLSRYRTFSVMFRASAGELKGVPGIGDAKVCRLFAAAELGKRMAEEKSASGGVMISCPADAARMLLPRMRDLKREVFKVICLDSQNRLIRVIEVEEGTVNHASPILREVFQKALEQFSSSIICATKDTRSPRPRPSGPPMSRNRCRPKMGTSQDSRSVSTIKTKRPSLHKGDFTTAPSPEQRADAPRV